MNRAFRKSKWDTPKTYGYNPPPQAPPLLGSRPSNPGNPPVSSLEAASAAAAKINAVLAAKGKLQLNKSKDSEKSRSNQNELVVAEIEINDVPVYCRNMLTKRTMQDTISRETGAAVSTRGRYMTEEDKVANTSGDRSLYLFVQALTKDKVDLAVNRIIDIIRNVSHGAATAPKVSYKNLSDSSTSNTLPGTKPLLGAAPGIPSVGNVFQDKIFVGLEHAHPSFNVKEKIQGPGGSFLSHIRVETGASVYLRGKGSGLMERASGRESFENLYIFITHQKQENLQAAKKLCENLVQTIQAEYSKYQAQLMAGPQAHQAAVSSVGPPQALQPSFQNVPPAIGVRPMLPPGSQAAVVTVAAQTAPLVSTGVPSGHPASSQAGQPVSMHHVTPAPAASSGVVVSVNNAVAYPHLQRFQVPAQQPALLTSPVPVGLPGSVPQRVALLIQPSTGIQQPHLPSGVVVTPRISAVVHPSGIIPQGIPIGVRPPVTLLPQRPSLVSEAVTPRFPPGVIATQTPGQEIRLATQLQPQSFPPHSPSGPPQQENVVLQPGQIPAGMHLQPPQPMVEQVGQQPQPTGSTNQQPPQLLHGAPLQQTDPGLDPHGPPVQQEMQPGQSLPETMHPSQIPVQQLQQIIHAPVQQEGVPPGQQVTVHQPPGAPQVGVQHSAAQSSSPQHIIIQQTPSLQSIPQSMSQSIQQPQEVQQHHQVVQGPPPPLFQTPPVQLPPHSQPPHSQQPHQEVTLRLPFSQGEPSILGEHPPQQHVSHSVALSVPQQLPQAVTVEASAPEASVAMPVKSMEPAVMSMADMQHMQQQEQQVTTSQAHLLQGQVPQSLAGTSEAFTQGAPVSTHHHALPPASSGLLPLPTSVLQYQVAPSRLGPTALVVTAEEPGPRIEHHFNNGKDREPRPASHLHENTDSGFGRRRRFREEFELDEKPLKSLRTSSDYERSPPYSTRYKDIRAEASREREMRGSDMFARRRRFQEAGDARSDFEFSRDRDLRASRFSDSNDRRLMPPPPPSRISSTTKPLLSSQKIQQPGFRHPSQGLVEGTPSGSLVSYDAGDSDSDSEEQGGVGFALRSPQNRFDRVRNVSQSPPHARVFDQPTSAERHFGHSSPTSRFSPPSSPRMHELSRQFQEQRRPGSRVILSPATGVIGHQENPLQGGQSLAGQALAGQPFWMARH